jgi:hypothetical protein
MSMQGEMLNMRMTLTSRWLGADCGDVKPVNLRP